MILLLIGLSTFTIGLSHATSCHSLQQSQLASLNERMNQMISALYSSPLSKKLGSSLYQTSTPTPPSDYSAQVQAQYDSYYGYQQPQQPSSTPVPAPNVIYMSPPHSSSPTTVAISPPAPGSPPTVTISSTRVPSSCYSQYEGQEYTYAPPKYAPQCFEYPYQPQYTAPALSPFTPPPHYSQYAPPVECACQYQPEYSAPSAPPAPNCPHSSQSYSAQPSAQPEFEYNPGGCPPAPCPPPPQYSLAPYAQPPSCPPPPSYPPPPFYPSNSAYVPPPCPQSHRPAYGPPAYPPQAGAYPPPSTYSNPRDIMKPPQF